VPLATTRLAGVKRVLQMRLGDGTVSQKSHFASAAPFFVDAMTGRSIPIGC
jgi:hypothetical protein